MHSGLLSITPLDDNDIAAVTALWERCGLIRPWNDPVADIALARRGDNAAVLIGREADRIVASLMVGHDGHRGWSTMSASIRTAVARALAARSWTRLRTGCGNGAL